MSIPPSLEVVDSLPAVLAMAESTYSNEMPGFQVQKDFVRKVGLLPVMDAIEQASENVFGAGIPFTCMPDIHMEARQYPPHIDAGERGLLVHQDMGDGSDIVQLAHLLDGTQPGQTGARHFIRKQESDSSQYTGGDITTACREVEHGQVYEGQLGKGMVTVFSLGNVGDLYPTIHYFKRSKVGSPWARYFSKLSDVQLSQDVLHDHATQFRLQVQKREYDQLTQQLQARSQPNSRSNRANPIESNWSTEEITRRLQSHPGKRITFDRHDPDMGIRLKTMGRRRAYAQYLHSKLSGTRLG